MSIKRWIAGVAVLATVGAVQIVNSGTVQAYTSSLSGDAVCQEDGSISVTWQYTTDDRVATIDVLAPASIAAPGVPTSTGGTPTTLTFVESYPAGTMSATVEVVVTFYYNEWHSGETSAVSTTISLPGDECIPTGGGEWCSPGYWRQPQHLDAWAATGISPDEKYGAFFTVPSSWGGADPTLIEVLQSPQRYNKGTGAFNNVGDLLSGAHPDVAFDGERVEDSCPLN